VQRKGNEPAHDQKCSKTITGTAFIWPENTAAAGQISDSAALLAAQGITLSLSQRNVVTGMGENPVPAELSSNTNVCLALNSLVGGGQIQLQNALTGGVVVLMAKVSGDVCNNEGFACYMSNVASICPTTSAKRVIIINQFTAPDVGPSTLAHELGHHALGPGHRSYQENNIMREAAPRLYFDNNQLKQICDSSFNFFK
jgi:hypothetical protein